MISAKSFDKGKVVDVAIFSKYCKCPKTNHLANCTANYKGSSGGIEVDVATQILHRSLEKTCAIRGTLVMVIPKVLLQWKALVFMVNKT